MEMEVKYMGREFDNSRRITSSSKPEGYKSDQMFDQDGNKVVSVTDFSPDGDSQTYYLIYPSREAQQEHDWEEHINTQPSMGD